MNTSKALEYILEGLICLGFGTVLIIFIRNKKKKKDTFNIYDFNLYIASVLLILVGLVLFFVGVKYLF